MPVIPACTYRDPAFARDRLIPKYTLVQRIDKAFLLSWHRSAGVRRVRLNSSP
jgi:hypothetical protein